MMIRLIVFKDDDEICNLDVFTELICPHESSIVYARMYATIVNSQSVYDQYLKMNFYVLCVKYSLSKWWRRQYPSSAPLTNDFPVGLNANVLMGPKCPFTAPKNSVYTM